MKKEDNFLISIDLYTPPYLEEKIKNTDTQLYSYKDESMTEEEFVKKYKSEVLVFVSIEEKVEKWRKMSNGKDIIICSTHSHDVFSFRHILSEHIENKLKIEINEKGFENQIRKDYRIKKPRTYNINEKILYNNIERKIIGIQGSLISTEKTIYILTDGKENKDTQAVFLNDIYNQKSIIVKDKKQKKQKQKNQKGLFDK